MSVTEIGKAFENTENCLQSQSDPGPRADVAATATIEDGLKCRIESPDGTAIYTDMPTSVGGSATANSPGWHLRAALASCDATLLAMRAARLGLELDNIEVRVEASSDGRGMFLDEEIKALVHWVEQHSPVGADIKRAVDVHSEIDCA